MSETTLSPLLTDEALEAAWDELATVGGEFQPVVLCNYRTVIS